MIEWTSINQVFYLTLCYLTYILLSIFLHTWMHKSFVEKPLWKLDWTIVSNYTHTQVYTWTYILSNTLFNPLLLVLYLLFLLVSELDLMGSVIGIDLNRLVKLVGPKTSHLDYLSLLFDWKCIQNEINWFTSVNFYGTDVPQVISKPVLWVCTLFNTHITSLYMFPCFMVPTFTLPYTCLNTSCDTFYPHK